MFSHLSARLAAVFRACAGRFALHSGAAAAAMIVAVSLSDCAAPPAPAAKAGRRRRGRLFLPVSHGVLSKHATGRGSTLAAAKRRDGDSKIQSWINGRHEDVKRHKTFKTKHQNI